MPREIEGFMHVWYDDDGNDWSIIVHAAQCPAQTGYCRGCHALDALNVSAARLDRDALRDGTLRLPARVECGQDEAP